MLFPRINAMRGDHTLISFCWSSLRIDYLNLKTHKYLQVGRHKRGAYLLLLPKDTAPPAMFLGRYFKTIIKTRRTRFGLTKRMLKFDLLSNNAPHTPTKHTQLRFKKG